MLGEHGWGRNADDWLFTSASWKAASCILDYLFTNLKLGLFLWYGTASNVCSKKCFHWTFSWTLPRIARAWVCGAMQMIVHFRKLKDGQLPHCSLFTHQKLASSICKQTFATLHCTWGIKTLLIIHHPFHGSPALHVCLYTSVNIRPFCSCPHPAA